MTVDWPVGINLSGVDLSGAHLEKAADKEVPVLSPLLTASADVTHEQDKIDRYGKSKHKRSEE